MATRMALFMAIILGVVSALAVRMWMQEEKTKIEKKNKPVPIVVAQGPLKKGQALQSKNIGVAMVTREYVVAGMIPWWDRRLHLGKVLTRPLRDKEPIFKSFLTTDPLKTATRKSFVSPGMRAVTMRVDQEQSVGYLVRPGAYVDIFATFEIRPASRSTRTAAGSSTGAGQRITKTICLMEAVKVLAVDNHAIDTVGKRRSSGTYRTITFEVDPVTAGRLINAKLQGRIQLVLRAPQDQKRALKNTSDFRWQDIK